MNIHYSLLIFQTWSFHTSETNRKYFYELFVLKLHVELSFSCIKHFNFPTYHSWFAFNFKSNILWFTYELLWPIMSNMQFKLLFISFVDVNISLLDTNFGHTIPNLNPFPHPPLPVWISSLEKSLPENRHRCNSRPFNICTFNKRRPELRREIIIPYMYHIAKPSVTELVLILAFIISLMMSCTLALSLLLLFKIHESSTEPLISSTSLSSLFPLTQSGL